MLLPIASFKRLIFAIRRSRPKIVENWTIENFRIQRHLRTLMSKYIFLTFRGSFCFHCFGHRKKIMSLAIWGIFAAASAANVSVIVSKLCNAQIFEVRERESAFVSLVYVTGLCRAVVRQTCRRRRRRRHCLCSLSLISMKRKKFLKLGPNFELEIFLDAY